MSKSANHKLKLYYLKKILIENTDSEHYITMKEIIDFLSNMGISAERKSIYNDIDLLRETGLVIVNHKRLGYAVVKKDFDISEIEIIVKALDSSAVAYDNKETIKHKLGGFLSKYEAERLLIGNK